MFKKNVKLKSYHGTSAWRKITIGTWRKSGDPSIYGEIEFDARPTLAKIDALKANGKKISPTVIVAKAIAVALSKQPRSNAFLRFGRVYHRQDVDIFLQVLPDKSGDDLSGLVIRQCDTKSLEDIADELQQKATKIRKGEDKAFKKTKQVMDFLPGWFIGPLLTSLSFILYALNIWSPFLNVPRDGFGSAMVTSIGSIGLERGFAPLVPYSRCPFVISAGKISDQVVAVDGKPEVQPILPLCVTLDHRIVDGMGAAKLVRELRRYFADPY